MQVFYLKRTPRVIRNDKAHFELKGRVLSLSLEQEIVTHNKTGVLYTGKTRCNVCSLENLLCTVSSLPYHHPSYLPHIYSDSLSGQFTEINANNHCCVAKSKGYFSDLIWLNSSLIFESHFFSFSIVFLWLL